MNRGKDRADRLAGSVPTVLAQHGLEWSRLHLRILALPKALDADPVQGASITRVLLHHERNVIFHRAGSHTGLAAGAYILVDDHAPFALRFLHQRPFRSHIVQIYTQTHNISPLTRVSWFFAHSFTIHADAALEP